MTKTSVSFNGTKSCSSSSSNPLSLKELNHSVAPVNTAFFAALAMSLRTMVNLNLFFVSLFEELFGY